MEMLPSTLNDIILTYCQKHPCLQEVSDYEPAFYQLWRWYDMINPHVAHVWKDTITISRQNCQTKRIKNMISGELNSHLID